MRTAHLFAGVGGGILADLILGHEPVVAVEWDAYACQVLREQFPGLRVIEGDVRTVDFARELVGIDALCAGFPCQDISAAGKGAGIDGERSGLYREVMRAIDAVRPEWVFLENSPRIRTRGRHIVIGDLVARGYSWRDGQLAASDVGAPHIRNRWWCLAANADGLRQLESQRRQPDQRGWLGNGPSQAADLVRDRLEISVQPGGLPGTEGKAIQAAARFTGARGWNPPDPDVLGMVDGVSDSTHRIRALGNAQVPLQAAFAWLALGGPRAIT